MTLEDLYNGKTTKLAVQRNVICSECNDIGGKEVNLHEVYAEVLLQNTGYRKFLRVCMPMALNAFVLLAVLKERGWAYFWDFT